MFPAHRQAKLDPILAKLRQIPGIEEVQADDFDSTAINVFLTLQFESQYRLTVPMQKIKAAIKRVLQEERRAFRFLDQPEKRYESNGQFGKMDMGYTTTSIKIDIEV